MTDALLPFAAVRWSYTMSTPNGAALAIALLLPLLWWQWPGDKPRSRWRLALLLCLEAVLCFLLAKTLSRGGFVAVLAGLAFFHGLSGLRRGGPLKAASIAFVARLALCLAMAFLGGLYRRGNPSYVAQDRSILNRVDVWKGACALVATNPIRGWGFETSGKMYVNWIQDHSTVHVYRGVMNLFLQLAVELGLAVGMLVLALALAIIAWPLFQPAADNLSLAASSAVLVWLVANLFSTLGEDWQVYALLFGWVGLWLWRLRARQIRWVGPVATAAAGSLVLGLGTCAAGQALKPAFALRELPRKGVAVARGHAQTPTDVYLDLQVLGRVPGQRLRRVLEANSQELRVWNEDPAPDERARVGVFFGRTCRLDVARAYDRVVLVNPPGVPSRDAFTTARVSLILSAEALGAPGWLELAREKGWSVFLVEGSYPYLEEAQDPVWYRAAAS